MDFEFEKPNKNCPVIDVDGVIASGKQYDLDITLPHDNRDVIYGVIKNCFKEPVCDAVVKLIEVDCRMGKEERKPVSHTFTDKNGEFVFGPLCPGKEYAIEIWVDDVKHVKVCAKSFHEGRCLKGVKLDKCDYDLTPCDKPHYNDCEDKKPCCDDYEDKKPCCCNDYEDKKPCKEDKPCCK